MASEAGTPIRVHAGNTFVGEFKSSGDERLDMETFERILHEAGHHANAASTDQRMRSQARSFAKVARQLFHTIAVRGGESADYIAPFVVNATFGIEVYLKAIGRLHGIEKRGHSLVALHDALPDEARNAIQVLVPETASAYELEQPIDVRTFFVGLNDAFTTWRYSYEGGADGSFVGATHALFLLDLLDAAHSKLMK